MYMYIYFYAEQAATRKEFWFCNKQGIVDSLKLAESIRSTVNTEAKADRPCSMCQKQRVKADSCRNTLYLPKINGIKLWQGIFTHQENFLWLRRMAKHWNKLPGTVVQSQASEEAGPKPIRDGRRVACWASKWNKFIDLAAKCMNP